MKSSIWIGLLLTFVFDSTVVAQETRSRELLSPIQTSERSSIESRYAYEVAEKEYFARPNRFELYSIDVGVLEQKGEITLTPFGGPAIKLVSHGVVHLSSGEESTPARMAKNLFHWNGQYLFNRSTLMGNSDTRIQIER